MSGYVEGLIALLSINIVLAYAAFLPIAVGQLNLGIAGFMAVGAYAAAYVGNVHGWPVMASSLVGAFAGGLVALIGAAVVLRTRGIYLTLATFALGSLLPSVFLNLEAVGGAAGYPVMNGIGAYQLAFAALMIFAIVAYLFLTRFGLVMQAVRNDEPMAEVFGINVGLIQAAAFVLGAMIAGFGGALYAHYYSYISPQNFSVLSGIYVVLYVLLGGPKTIFGPLIGAAVFTLLPELLRDSDQWRYVLFALLIIVVMIFSPDGIADRDAWVRLFSAAKQKGAVLFGRSARKPAAVDSNTSEAQR